MEISESGLAFLRLWESFRPCPERDEFGRLLIGYGHRVRDGEHWAEITEAQADAVLRVDLGAVVRALAVTVPGPFAPHEIDALCSLAFEVGAGALVGSALVRHFSQGSRRAAADEFLTFGHPAQGRYRRIAERALFLGATLQIGEIGQV